MTAKLSLALASTLCAVALPAHAEEASPAPSAYVARVDPAAFPERPSEYRKLGVTVSPATVRLITPGVDKFSIYNLIGPPHFGEAIANKWNYVLFFPPMPGTAERQRCRMEIRFSWNRKNGNNRTVSEVVWKDQACADRVAAAG
jgi:outer membrane protein assembly factor BamE (lipoprotein component of BamABCDE complex)